MGNFVIKRSERVNETMLNFARSILFFLFLFCTIGTTRRRLYLAGAIRHVHTWNLTCLKIWRGG